MKKKIVVISLGGSLIIPDKINTNYLKRFKEVILKATLKYKFIIVAGGGNIAREYIYSLKSLNMDINFQSFAGISATRMNARFVSYLFGFDQNYGIPRTLQTVDKYLKHRDIVFCGALDYKPNQTSDSTSAEIATHFNTEFINLTNVDGLFDKDPSKYKKAKLIKNISWEDFLRKVNLMTFSPGQHFVLDQTAAKIIQKNKIKTYIIGKDLVQLSNLLKDKPFRGTTIFG